MTKRKRKTSLLVSRFEISKSTIAKPLTPDSDRVGILDLRTFKLFELEGVAAQFYAALRPQYRAMDILDAVIDDRPEYRNMRDDAEALLSSLLDAGLVKIQKTKS